MASATLDIFHLTLVIQLILRLLEKVKNSHTIKLTEVEKSIQVFEVTDFTASFKWDISTVSIVFSVVV